MANIGFMLLSRIAILYCLIRSAESMKCYNCTSKELPDKCGHDFKLNVNSSKYIVDNCDNCLKTFYTDTKVIVRNCTESGKTKFSFRSGCSKEKVAGSDVKTCACNKDLCNGTVEYFSTTYMLLLVPILMTIF